jgi:CBS domain-containing protein
VNTLADRRNNGRMATVERPFVSAAAAVRAPLLDRAGERLGRVGDIVVRLADGHYPPVTGLRARIGGRSLFVPAQQIASLAPHRVQLSGETLNLARFERRPGEVLLDEDVLGRRLIDVASGHLVHAHDIALARVEGWWRVVGVDPRPVSGMHRMVPWRTRSGVVAPDAVIDWWDVEPFVGHVPTARLPMPLRRLRRLHPAQIADLVEHASRDEGAEIIEAVRDDPDLEADVFEELDVDHQRRHIERRSDAEAAALLAEMEPDDAADLIGELDQERRASILRALPASQQEKVRRLLAYHPDTAGGMMGPDVVTVGAEATVADALAAVRATEDMSPQQRSSVVLLSAEGTLVGTVALSDVVRADPSALLRDIGTPVPARLRAETDLPDVALMMTDYNLTALPVVDAEGRVIGVVTVDDLLEAMVPLEWRHRRGDDRA